MYPGAFAGECNTPNALGIQKVTPGTSSRTRSSTRNPVSHTVVQRPWLGGARLHAAPLRFGRQSMDNNNKSTRSTPR